MSAPVPAVIFQFAKARSDFIDAHNTVELAVRRKLERLKMTGNHLFGQNIEALAKVPAGPQYAKQERARIHDLLNELREIQSIRCDIVHSRMETIEVDGLDHGFFSNVQKRTRHGRNGTLLSLAEMDACTQSLRNIADALEA